MEDKDCGCTRYEAFGFGDTLRELPALNEHCRFPAVVAENQSLKERIRELEEQLYGESSGRKD